MRTLVTMAAMAAIAVVAGRSQGLPDQVNFLSSDREGIHLYGVSGFFGYSALDYPQALTTIRNYTSYGVSGTVGWQHLRGRTNIIARYTGGFYGDPQNTNLNRFNQSASIAISRPLGAKWAAEVSASGADLSYQQYIFESSALGSLTQSTAGFDDLAAAFSIGQYTSSQAGLKLNQSPDLNSPTRAVLLGTSVLSYAAQAGLSYSPTSRLQFHISSFALGGEHRGSSLDAVSGTPNYILPRTLGATAGVDMSYSLSPRTSVGVGVSQSYVSSTFQKSYATSGSGSLGRKMGEHWFLNFYGGLSRVESAQQAVGAPPASQFIGGASIGFRTYAHAFMASCNRSASDISSAAVGTNSNFSGAWNWHHPHRTWGLFAGFTESRTSNTGYSSVSGWRASFGYSQRLVWNLALSANYSYLRSRGAYLATLQEVSLNAVRISISWVPHRGHWPVPATTPAETLQ